MGIVSTDIPIGQAISEIVDRIVHGFHPEQVILFGSHARGSATPDSDVDLLVVMDAGGSPRKKAIEIGVVVHEVRVPKDIVVTTPDGFLARRSVVGTIERYAALDGKVLYERR